MVVDEPVSELTLATVLEVTQDEISQALSELTQSYGERGFALKSVAGGWRFYSHPDSASVVEKFVLDGQQSRLTQAALETLAVIATRGLVEEYGLEPETGAILYKTTNYFLERLGLNSLEDLPALAPYLPDLEHLDEILDSLVD